MELYLKCKKVKDIQIGEEIYHNMLIYTCIDYKEKEGFKIFESEDGSGYTRVIFLSLEHIVITDDYILNQIEIQKKLDLSMEQRVKAINSQLRDVIDKQEGEIFLNILNSSNEDNNKQ